MRHVCVWMCVIRVVCSCVVGVAWCVLVGTPYHCVDIDDIIQCPECDKPCQVCDVCYVIGVDITTLMMGVDIPVAVWLPQCAVIMLCV